MPDLVPGQPAMPSPRQVTNSTAGPPSPVADSEPGHHISHWGKAEYCTRCGRVTAASSAGRAQQWRRLCQPLPSYIAKLQKGHRLVYIGHWHCTQCSCPADRLYRTRCARLVESPRPKPLALTDPLGPLDPRLDRGTGDRGPSQVVRSDGGDPSHKTKSVVTLSAQGSHTRGPPVKVRASKPPVQSQLERFFPDAKRPRLRTAEHFLDQGHRRHRPGVDGCMSAQGNAQGDVCIGQASRVDARSRSPDFQPEAKRSRVAVVGHRSLPQASGRPPG